jgi:hypothetical protein
MDFAAGIDKNKAETRRSHHSNVWDPIPFRMSLGVIRRRIFVSSD